MHSVATMSSFCIRDPALVERIGLRALSDLKATVDVSLECVSLRLSQPEYFMLHRSQCGSCLLWGHGAKGADSGAKGVCSA